MSKGGAGGIVLIASIVVGAVLDIKYMDPFFHSLTLGTSTVNWSSALTLLFFHGVPLVASIALVVSITGTLIGGRRR